jgi:hypothetical protein
VAKPFSLKQGRTQRERLNFYDLMEWRYLYDLTEWRSGDAPSFVENGEAVAAIDNATRL